MKKKALVALACATCACALVLTGCTSGEFVQFNPNWDPYYSHNELSNTLHEEFEYKVKYNAGASNGDGYSFTYCTSENSASDPLLNTYKVVLDGTANGTYTLVQECHVEITYNYGGQTEEFVNVTRSEVTFGKATSGLKPIRSFRKVVSYTPTSGTPGSFDDCYNLYNYDIEIVYNSGATQAESVKINDYEGTFLGEKTAVGVPYEEIAFGIDASKYTYLDNEQLYFAFRGLDDATMKGTSHVNSYDESANRVRALVLSAVEQGNTTDYSEVSVNGTAIGETAIAFNKISLAKDGANSGASQELCYASSTATILNDSARNVLLKVKTNMPYNFGSLEYNLKSIVWND